MNAAPSPIAFSDADLFAEPDRQVPVAAARIRRLASARRLPLVLCSTQTRAELECLQRRLDFSYPFICENGAAVYVPEGYFNEPVPGARLSCGYEVVTFGSGYGETVDALRRAATQLGIDVVGFHDLSIDDVAMECRLPLPQARLAKMREYGEPFRIAPAHANRRAELFGALHDRGFACIRGGQFDYVGPPVDEVTGIRLLQRCYERALGPIITVGVGDPSKDARLLNEVQIPIELPRRADWPEIIRKPHLTELSTERPPRPFGHLFRRLALRAGK